MEKKIEDFLDETLTVAELLKLDRIDRKSFQEIPRPWPLALLICHRSSS